jgi:DNA polymerase III sliding clamp (beta) subunit (PCNA family)
LHGDEATISFNGKLEACVIADAKDSSYLHVIMPLKS